MEDVSHTKSPLLLYSSTIHCKAAHTKTGHVTINLDDVNLPSKLHIFANANTNSTYFLCRSQYFNICSKAVTRWLKHHGLPPQLASAFMQKITTEWKLHLDPIDNLPRFSFHAVQHLLHWLPKGLCNSSWWSWTISFDLILSSAIFSRCPQLPSCNTWTWNDPELFEQLPISPHEAQVCIQQAFPTCLVRTYPWGFRKKATLPYGFVCLKREKIGKKVGLWLAIFRAISPHR